MWWIVRERKKDEKNILRKEKKLGIHPIYQGQEIILINSI